jgi:hypothetical protein
MLLHVLMLLVEGIKGIPERLSLSLWLSLSLCVCVEDMQVVEEEGWIQLQMAFKLACVRFEPFEVRAHVSSKERMDSLQLCCKCSFPTSTIALCNQM